MSAETQSGLRDAFLDHDPHLKSITHGARIGAFAGLWGWFNPNNAVYYWMRLSECFKETKTPNIAQAEEETMPVTLSICLRFDPSHLLHSAGPLGKAP